MIDEMGKSTEVLERLMSSYGVRTQKELALALGIPANNISGWNQRDNVPGNSIIKCVIDTGADLQWLVSGELAKASSHGSQPFGRGKALYEKIMSNGGRPVLRRIMDAYGFTLQKQLCELLDISSGTVSTWVRRDYFPGDVVVACALDTGVSLQWLATGKGESTSNEFFNQVVRKIPKLRYESGRLKEAGYWIGDISLFSTTLCDAEYIEGIKYSWLIDKSQDELGSGRWLVAVDGVYDVFDISRLPGGKLRLTNISISYECSAADIQSYGVVLFTFEKHV
ncbi:helix-turn-helix domain-containing protein [Erwinia pyri]|uniref:Helix-turn-helix domain-containing protein n=1 Tax=Erwinia pyri TaxID=3062598 RepID=A0AA50DJ37_9GAMM|nr:helix-turn-helix domain-containing protein [Erwinia sp. DE2]WLS77146.1 helix-turn-helix domain-containing protein [Erwinia sp. DE2]